MEPRCPEYIAPRLYTDPRIDKSYEGSAWCTLIDKRCTMEHGGDCEEYNEWLKEIGDEVL